MKKKRSISRTKFINVLWAVLSITLCGTPIINAEDISGPVTGPLFITGTTNLLPGAAVSDSIYVLTGGILNVYAGTIPATSFISVSPGAMLTVYGTDFAVDTVPVDYGVLLAIGSGVLTGTYENEDPISLWILSDAAINLEQAGGTTENTPPEAEAGPDVAVTTLNIASTIIEGSATDADDDPLEYRWLRGETELTLWQTVGANGEAPLNLGNLLPQYVQVGTHILTLEVSDAQEIVSDTMILTIGVQQIQIDIKPGSDDNTINLGSNGVIPVAILSSAVFDATALDPDSITLAGAGVAVRGKGNKYLASQMDVNDDGLLDLEVKIETENLDPGTFQDGKAVLQVFDGATEIYSGSDLITIVPPA